LLKDRLGVPHISTGDAAARRRRRRHTAGLKAKAAMDAGELVSDELMLGLIEERLGADDVKAGYILDGYPRNLAQARALDEVLAAH
jgi:adenylate kinase